MPDSPAPMMRTSKCSVKGVRGGSAMLPVREAKVPHYAPDVAELPRSREGCRQRNGRRATGTDQGVRPYTGLLRGARYFYAFGTRRVTRDAFVEGFGDLLAVAVAAKFLFVGGTGYERDFCQDSWHRAFG